MLSVTRAIHLLCASAMLMVPVAALQAQITTFTAFLTGANENPAVVSPGTGLVTVTLDQTLNTMQVKVSFSGLIGTTTAAHIHCCAVAPANVDVATTTPTFAGFPLGVTSGSYDYTLDMTMANSFNATYVTANGGSTASAFTALSTGMLAEQSYFNVHTTTAPGGEIRGQLQVVPEPSTLALTVAGFVALGLFARRRTT